MQLWLIRRTDSVGYDEFDAFVIRAKDEESARNMAGASARADGGMAMGIRIIASDGVALLYCSTSMRPINTEAFASEEEAHRFLAFAKAHNGVDVRTLPQQTLESLHDEFRALPACHFCGERVVTSSERADECEDCRPPCEAAYCDYRGSETVDRETYCPEHAAEVRRRRRRYAETVGQ